MYYKGLDQEKTCIKEMWAPSFPAPWYTTLFSLPSPPGMLLLTLQAAALALALAPYFPPPPSGSLQMSSHFLFLKTCVPWWVVRLTHCCNYGLVYPGDDDRTGGWGLPPFSRGPRVYGREPWPGSQRAKTRPVSLTWAKLNLREPCFHLDGETMIPLARGLVQPLTWSRH